MLLSLPGLGLPSLSSCTATDHSSRLPRDLNPADGSAQSECIQSRDLYVQRGYGNTHLDGAMEEPLLLSSVAIDVGAILEGFQVTPLPMAASQGDTSPLTAASRHVGCAGSVMSPEKGHALPPQPQNMYMRASGATEMPPITTLDAELEVPFTTSQLLDERPLAVIIHSSEPEQARNALEQRLQSSVQAMPVPMTRRDSTAQPSLTGSFDDTSLQHDAQAVATLAQQHVSASAAVTLWEEKYAALTLSLPPGPDTACRADQYISEAVKAILASNDGLRILPADLYCMNWSPQRALASAESGMQAVPWGPPDSATRSPTTLRSERHWRRLCLGGETGDRSILEETDREELQTLVAAPPLPANNTAMPSDSGSSGHRAHHAKEEVALQLRPTAGPMNGLEAYLRLRGGPRPGTRVPQAQPVRPADGQTPAGGGENGASSSGASKGKAALASPVQPSASAAAAASAPTVATAAATGAGRHVSAAAASPPDTLPAATTVLCSAKVAERGGLVLLLERYVHQWCTRPSCIHMMYRFPSDH